MGKRPVLLPDFFVRESLRFFVLYLCSQISQYEVVKIETYFVILLIIWGFFGEIFTIPQLLGQK